MKKRLINILAIVMLIFACCVTTACNDKYDKFEYNIQYAFSEDSEHWFDANDGISLNYGGEFDALKLFNGCGTIYIKVQINNVKEKYLDEIIVTSNANTTITTKVNTPFAFNVDSAISQTTLRFYETNSGKQQIIRLSIFSSLKEIVADDSFKPAVMAGCSVDLTEFNNLNFISNSNISYTNQTAVTYSLLSLGCYDSLGDYQATHLAANVSENDISLKDGVLTVADDFEVKNNAYIAKIRATSVYHDGTVEGKELDYIYDDFDVYVVEKLVLSNGQTAYSPIIEKIKENGDVETISELKLYKNDEIYNSNNADVNVNLDGLSEGEQSSVYTNGVYTADGLAKYMVQVLLNGELVDVTTEPSERTPLRITEGTLSNQFNVLAQEYDGKENALTFRVVVEGLNYSQIDLTYETSINVITGLLPTGIMVNGQTINGAGSGIIYSTTSADYNGVSLTLEATPVDKYSTPIIVIDGETDNVEISGATETDGTLSVVSGGTIFVKFANGATSANLRFKVRKSPETFAQEEFAEVSYGLTKVVTADEIEIYPSVQTAQAGGDDANIANGKMFINALDTTNMYLRVYYSGSLMASSVKVVSGNGKVVFANGSTTIALDNINVAKVGGPEVDNAGKTYQIFAIPFRATNELISNVNVSVIAGEGNVGVQESVTVESVYVAEHDGFVVETNSSHVTKFDDFKNAFAVVYNQLVDFEVKGKLVGSAALTSKAVNNIIPQRKQEIEFNSNGFNAWAADVTQTSNCEFSLKGTMGNKTQVTSLTIYYYSNKTEQEDDIINLRYITIDVQFAVYNPISNVEARTDNTNVVYINEFYKDASETTINFTAYAGNVAPASSIKFMDEFGIEQTIENVTQLELSYAWHGGVSDQPFAITLNNGNTPLTNNSVLQETVGEGVATNVLNGRLQFKLNENPVGQDSVTLVLTALRFGEESSYATQITINFVTYDAVKGITISGNEIVKAGKDGNNLYMSFMDVEVGGFDQAGFYATPYYEDVSNKLRFDKLGYELYRIEQNDDGSEKLVDGKRVLVRNDSLMDITIDHETRMVTVKANRAINGGLFMLNIVALDSYIKPAGATQGKYLTSTPVFLHVGDGSVKNPYSVATREDFNNIKNDLSANYILINNINLGTIEMFNTLQFTGSFKGQTSFVTESGTANAPKLTLTYTLNAMKATGDNGYMGLFGIVGEDAYIGGFIVDVTLNLNAVSLQVVNGNLFAGALAGVNNGTIENIDASISLSSSITDNVKSINAINLGGLVGENNGLINLVKSTIRTTGNIITSSNVTHNIGSVAGRNGVLGVISGDFNDKESLNSINFTVLTTIRVEYQTALENGSNILLGGVVGENRGEIKRMIIGGELEIAKTGTAKTRYGLIGGVAASSVKANIETNPTINTCSVLSLNILGCENVDVAGIVASSNETEITLVRVLSTVTEFGGNTCYGAIYGLQNVGGIAAVASGGTITNATVETFLQVVDGEQFSTLNGVKNDANTTVVAGLVAKIEGTSPEISNSFVNANIKNWVYDGNDNATTYLTSPLISEVNTYFVGKVLVHSLTSGTHANFGGETNVNASASATSYAVIYAENEVYSSQQGVISQFDVTSYVEEWQIVNFLTVNSTVTDSTNFENVTNLYYIALGASSYAKVEADHVYAATNTYYDFNEALWESSFDEVYTTDLINYTLNSNPEFSANKAYYKPSGLDVNAWNEAVKNWLQGATWAEDGINDGGFGWELSSSNNAVLFKGFNLYFPYIVERVDEENVPLMISRPTNIKAEINKPFTIIMDSIYVSGYVGEFDETQITGTVLVNFKNGKLANNRHKLINTAVEGQPANGLIDLTVIPTGAVGGVDFKIVQGSAYAYLTDVNNEKYIVFTGLTGESTPIIIYCYSKFNVELKEYIEIYTTYGSTNLTLQSNSVYATGEEGEGAAEYEMRTHLSAGKTLIYADAVNADNFGEHSSIMDLKLKTGLLKVKVEALINSILDINDNNNIFNQIDLKVKDGATFDGDKTEELLNIKLLFNLGGYLGKAEQWIELESTTLRVIITKSATSIEIDGADYEITTNSNVNFTANLYTGFVNSSIEQEVITITDANYIGNRLVLNEKNKDSIELRADVIRGESELVTLMRNADVDFAIDLFNFAVNYKAIKVSGQIVGYAYGISMGLKNEHNYRFIENEIEFNITVYAVSDNTIADSISLTLKPTEVSTIRIENYTAISSSAQNNLTTLISSNATETSIISPGGLGGVMVIYLEPSYSNIINAELTSTSLFVPDLGRNVQIKFEQLLFNAQTGKYHTIYPRNEEVENGIRLEKVSAIDEFGNKSYNGVIYVHTMVDKFVGLSGTLKANLEVTTASGAVKTSTKTLITKYLPGADISYNGHYIGQTTNSETGETVKEYLVQTNTYNNELQIKIYGYEFNANPAISFNWVVWDNSLNNGQGGYRLDGVAANGGAATKLINEDISQFVSYRLLNNISNLKPNGDGSFTISLKITVGTDLPAAFAVGVSMALITEDDITVSESSRLILHPTNYLLNATTVKLANVSNNEVNIHINKQKSLTFAFETDNNLKDYSSEIFNILVEKVAGKEALFDETKLFELFICADGKPLSEHAEFTFDTINNNIITISGNSKYNGYIGFTVHFGYEDANKDGVYELTFGASSASTLQYVINFAFKLNVFASETREDGIPLYTVNDIFDENGNCLLSEGAHYVLMNDITLENLTPINVKIGSLDGNNKIIKINSFAIDTNITEYGLFSSISTYVPITDQGTQVSDGVEQPTLLYNVVVDYSGFSNPIQFTNNEFTNITFGGLVGRNNGGLIYNCDVLNLSNRNAEVKILVDNNTNTNVVFGGLVGVNQGESSIITNSRVGRKEFTKLNVTDTKQYTTTKYGSNLTFTLGDASNQGFVGIAGGFVGENTGKISGCYVANTTLANHSAVSGSSKTAGFAAENSGKGRISYSYVKGDENTISSLTPRASGSVQIEAKSNGNVAGFVYLNSANVDNCFTNVPLTSNSAYVAGFVYNNAQSGIIAQSYAANILNAKHAENDASEQPFVGVSEADELLSFGTLENCYYYSVDNLIVKQEADKHQAKGLNTENITNSENLLNFVFVLSNSSEEREQGIWSYYNNKKQYVILPELSNANNVAHSYRYIAKQDADGKDVYHYAVVDNYAGYNLGSKFNPQIITSVDDFNNILTSKGNSNSVSGYYRIVNDIDFESDKTAIKTRREFTFGSSTAITSLEGNGLDIKGILLDVGESVEKSLGLFANVETAYIKNVNLHFTNGSFSSANVQYSGGLAGRMNNSVVINVNLNGGSTTINGKNFVGALAGLVTGKSVISGITSNVSANANATSEYYYLYHSKQNYSSVAGMDYDTYLTKLSYAGGIVGVMDITPRERNNFNLSYITINGHEMTASPAGMGNVMADYAGGIAGYASEHVSAVRLKYNVGETNRIAGQMAVGGLFGVYLGKMEASQVTALEDDQYTYDTTIGKYVIDVSGNDALTAALNTEEAGNIALIEGYNYAGGLIGIGINTKIDSCYSKAGFYSGKYVGGLIGNSVASQVAYSYAVPYLSPKTVTGKTFYENVGGLIGVAYASNEQDTIISNYIDVLTSMDRYKDELNFNSVITTDIQRAFATVITDIKVMNEIEEHNTNFGRYEYVVGQSKENALTSKSGWNTVYYGTIGGNALSANFITNNNIEEAQSIRLKSLYDLTAKEEQQAEFNKVFNMWEMNKYWDCNSEKYFPLLKKDAEEDFYIIDDAFDWDMLIKYPNRKYKVVKDMNLSSWIKRNSNYVFDVNFSGMLIGEPLVGQGTPKISGLSVVANNPGSAGLFKSTEGAIMANLEWCWTDVDNQRGAILVGNSAITDIGGVTCFDSASTFTSITVSIEQLNGNLVNCTNHPISGFGGIVARGYNSYITNCNYNINANILLKKQGTDNSVAVGAMAGDLAYQNFNAEQSGISGINQENVNRVPEIYDSNIGISNGEPKDLMLNVTLAEQEGTYNYVGAVVGRAENLAVSNVRNGAKSTKTNLKINLNGAATEHYLGGFVGYAVNSRIADASMYTKLQLSGNTESVTNVGGLVGLLDTTYALEKNVVYAEINLALENEQLNIANLNVAIGAAQTYGEATFVQTILDGFITSESELGSGEESRAQISTIYAGGAVGLALGKDGISAQVSVLDVTTLADITIGTPSVGESSTGTSKLYVGGFVGSGKEGAVNLVANNAVSAGKIVPITADAPVTLDGENPEVELSGTKIYVGGFGGLIKTLSSNRAFSTVSIIADGLGYNVIPVAKLGALCGEIIDNRPQEGATDSEFSAVNETYYSTDLALNEEASNLGTNLSTYTFAKTNVWQTEFTEENGWLSFGASSLPCVASLKYKLSNMGRITTFNGLEDFEMGSSLNPKVLTETDNTMFDNKFAYYILSNNLSKLKFGAKNLNGIIIGSEKVYELDVSSLESDGGNKGMFATIGKHSAVSNFNINLNVAEDKDISVDLSVQASVQAFGFVAGFNEGVIFNSSVSGNRLRMITVDRSGVLVGLNAGLISNSYANTEILETGTIGGLVGFMQDGAKLNSCYFTGYLGNTTGSAVGGIFVQAESQETKYYVYNTYMAGTLASVGEFGSFATVQLQAFNGLNNFVDELADLQITEDVVAYYKVDGSETSERQYVLSKTSTVNLMRHSKLIGSGWTTVVSEDETTGMFVIDNSTELAQDGTLSYVNPSFGYNYGYPMYSFNKICAANGELKPVNEMEYELFTGTGFADSTNLQPSMTLDELRVVYKIPNLGVLSAVQGLLSSEDGARGLNYLLIYDINGSQSNAQEQNKFINWGNYVPGAEENKTEFLAGPTVGFNGRFMSNKGFTTKTLTEVPANTENACTIQNLEGFGLLDNMGKVHILNLKFGNFYNLLNSGAIGGTLEGDNSTIQNIEFIESETDNSTTEVTGALEENNAFGGLLGNLSGSVEIKQIKTAKVDGENITNLVKLIQTGSEGGGGNTSYVGLIAGKMSGDDETVVKLDSSHMAISITASEKSYVGGLIGNMEGGTLLGTKDGEEKMTTITCMDANINSAHLGGIIGRMSASCAIDGINVRTVVAESTEDDDIDVRANTYGGVAALCNGGNIGLETGISVKLAGAIEANKVGFVVAQVTGNLTINNLVVEMPSQDGAEEDKTIRLKTKQFGMLAASLTGGNLQVNNVLMQGEEENLLRVLITVPKETEEQWGSEGKDQVQGYGVLAGYMAERQTSIATTASEFKHISVAIKTEDAETKAYNLGGLVGYFSGGLFNLQTETMEGIKLHGINNVGGAFGYCEAMPKIAKQEETVPASEDEERTIWNFLCDKAENGWAELATRYDITAPEGGFNNWGGLVGKLGCSFEYIDENDEPVTIVNRNKISLGLVNNQGGATINNVGGVIGFTDAKNITIANVRNDADISYHAEGRDETSLIEHDFITDLKSKIQAWSEIQDDAYAYLNEGYHYTFIKAVNVGGIIGCTGKNIATDEIITLTNAINTADVEGYQNVGGVIGLAIKVNFENDLPFTEAASRITEAQFEIGKFFTKSGVDYVPAAEWEATTTYYSLNLENEDDKCATAGNVYGLFNVGGVVGSILSGSFKNVLCEVENLYGNSNVGGFTGYFSGSSIVENCVVNVKKTEDINGNVITNGIVATTIQSSTITYHETPIEYNSKKFNMKETINFIFPTSVGGFAGSTSKTNSANNNVINVSIGTANEGDVSNNGRDVVSIQGAGTMDAGRAFILEVTSPVISTISNLMTEYKNISEQPTTVISISGIEKVDFNKLNTGIGGFVGTMKFIPNETNKMLAEVEASVGVNVGTFYGFYDCGTDNLFKTPKLVSNKDKNGQAVVTSVTGAYNVGGVAGGIECLTQDKELGIRYQGGDLEVQKNVDITGMYVGGLFGKIVGNVSAMSTGSKITIHTKNSYYIGGLIGKLEGNMGATYGNSDAAKSYIDATNVKVAEDEDKATNVGGLVGLLKVKDTGGNGSIYTVGEDVTVLGYHEFPFTVNTIMNSNYVDGDTSYSIEEEAMKDENAISLQAQAYYVNKDNFLISATGDAEIYGNDATNPLNPEAKGWAKDYTAFKSLMRVVPQENNNGAQWEAISEIYDASKITHVGTIGNLGLTRTLLAHPTSSTGYLIGGAFEGGKDHICFTVYEEQPGAATLYSAMGFASIVTDEDGNYATEAPKEQVGKWWQWCGAILGITDPPTSVQYINANDNRAIDILSPEKQHGNGMQGLTYFRWGVDGKWDDTHWTLGGDQVSYYQTADKVKGVVYRIGNYLGQSAYFIFDVIYENSSMSNLEGLGTITSTLPASGSIFEVNGVITNSARAAQAKEGKSFLYWLVLGIGVVVTIASIFVSGGYAGVAKLVFKGAKFAAKGIFKVLRVACRFIVKFTSNHRKLTAVLALVSLITIHTINYVSSRNVWVQKSNQSFGFISSTYSREVRYVDGIMDYQIEQTLEYDETIYMLYSSERPSDYYEHFFITEDSNESEPDVFNKKESSEKVKTVFKENGTLSHYELADGSGIRCHRYYIYKGGVYYIIYNAFDSSYYPTQKFVKEEFEENEYSLNSYNGLYYIRGKYENGEYTYDDLNGINNIKYAGGSYSVNGASWYSSFYSQIGIPVEYEEDRTFVRTDSGTESNGVYTIDNGITSINYYYGYGYMKNPYYTTYGNPNAPAIQVKATYTSGAGRGAPGVDYFTRTYYTTQEVPGVDEEGNPTINTINVPHQANFQLAERASGTQEESEGEWKGGNGAPVPGDYIIVTLYPYSFTHNPYKLTPIQGINEYYVYRPEPSETDVVIEHTAKFYYYDGGYVAGPLTDGEGNVYEKHYLHDDELEETFTIYNFHGTAIDVKINNFITNFNSYKNYYIVNLKDVFDGESYSATDANVQYFLVSNHYIIKNSELYSKSETMAIYKYALTKINLQLLNTNTDTNLNANKYLANAKYQIYTRYKIDLSVEPSKWANSAYSLFPPKKDYSGSPNAKTTYLTESVNVTLAGNNVRLHLAESNSETVNAGSITIS